MSIKITIPNTSSDTLTFGSANTPTAAQIAGIDSGSSNGQLAIYTTASGTSTERVRVDASGNVGVGTASPSSLLHVSSSAATNWQVRVSGTSAGNFSAARFYNDAGSALDVGISGSTASYGASLGMIGTATNNPLTFKTNDTERMRIDSSGNLLLNTTSTNSNEKMRIKNGNDSRAIAFQSASAAECGYIYINAGGTGVTYSTSSDYRLKEDIAPMTGALAKVAQLKPVTYKWKINGSHGQGFIAHELAEVVPDCVTGEKDAVTTYIDEDGNEATRHAYQGIDTSFLVATLTAAIQEQQALITALTARITALENK